MFKISSFIQRSLLAAAVTVLYAGLSFSSQGTQEPQLSPPHTIDLKMEGFFSAVAGRILTNKPVTPLQTNAHYNCPCYLADWSNAGVYNQVFSLNPESRLGLQLDATFTPKFDITTQLVSRSTSMGPNLSWLYGTYHFNDQWEVQVGRKRIPFYFYSEFQDVGIAYPWITPPPELYGWEATNYNGVSIRYANSFGKNEISASFLGGQEKVASDLYDLLASPDHSQEMWNHLLGGDFSFSHDPLTTRIVYLQTNTSAHDLDTDAYVRSHQRSYGVALNLDFGKSFILTEITELDRNYYDLGYTVKAPASSFGYGYRIGAWTPFINYAKYWESTSQPLLYTVVRFDRYSATLRYDLNANSAIKVQLDRNLDRTLDYTGLNTIFRISYDLVF